MADGGKSGAPGWLGALAIGLLGLVLLGRGIGRIARPGLRLPPPEVFPERRGKPFFAGRRGLGLGFAFLFHAAGKWQCLGLASRGCGKPQAGAKGGAPARLGAVVAQW